MRRRIAILCFILGGLVLFASSEFCPSTNQIPLNIFRNEDNVPEISNRIDCHPEPSVSRERCESRGCIYEEVEEVGAPWCYYPQDSGYRLVSEPVETQDGYIAHLARQDSPQNGPASDSSPEVWVQVFMQNNHRLRILYTSSEPSFQVPIDIPSDGRMPSDPLYSVTFTSDPTFGITVYRRSTGEVILDTSLPGFEHGHSYISLPMRFPEDSTLYGWGENEQHTLAHNMSWQTYGLYGRDQPPSGASNMYGAHPRLTLLDKNGDTAGILFLNSAAQEISLTPMPGAIYRTIGGLLDVYLFLGPAPEQVVQQYTDAVGRTPLPPYWSLGFHLCRYGYMNLTNMQAARDRMVKYEIPQDAQWGDIDIMERQLDFTVDSERFGGLPQYVEELKSKNVRFVTILDPCISIGEPNCTYRPFDLGEQFGVWIHNPDGSPFIGKVWPEDPVYFPDYTNPRTHEWWKLLIKEFYDLIKFDGLWIDMNEPANFVAGDINKGCEDNKINYPNYLPHVRVDTASNGLSDKTMCPDAQQYLGLHYYLHNMFGWFQSKPTLEGVKEATGKRGLVLSRSTYVGSGKWVAHWLGDNFSNWLNLKYSIIGMLQFNQFGIPFVGADICGFIGNTEAELCARWQQLGAFYPFSRNHNALGTIEQDPGVFGEEVAAITKKALTIRYALLPFLYTLFYLHTFEGGTVVRPLWHEFPRDQETRNIDEQFLWGKALMISPVLEKGATSRSIYLPKDTRWYSVSDFFDTTTYQEETTSGWIEYPAPADVIPLHMRGGAAIPIQTPGLNTVESRKGTFGLYLALDDNLESAGYLYYDDGESIESVSEGLFIMAQFTFSENELTYKVLKDGWAPGPSHKVDLVVLLGLRGEIDRVEINGMEHNVFYQNEVTANIYNLGGLFINHDWNLKVFFKP